jgi:hypothetical protein
MRNRISPLCAALAAVVGLTAGAREMAAQAALLQRPTEVTAVLGNSPKLYDGRYSTSQVSRMCGETDPLQSFTGQRIFVVEYPLDYSAGTDIVDVRFSSRSLVGAARQTSTFLVSVTVKAKIGGQPPAYVVDTERPAPDNSGSASLQVVGGVATLSVRAVDQLGQTLDLTVVCHPSRP